MDFAKGALVFTTFAVHMHSYTISGHGFSLNIGYYYDYDEDTKGKGNKHRERHDYSDRDDAIKAFLIIAFLLYLVAFLLQVISHTGGDLKLGKKIIGIILFILLILAAFSVFVALGVYGDVAGEHIPEFPTAAYVLGALCGIVAAIFVLLSGCKG